MSRSAANIALLIAGLALGTGSAIYSLRSLGAVQAAAQGPWQQWQTGSDGEASPYALAHYLLEGKLPPPEGLFRIYYAATDNEGKALSSSCTYIISTPVLSARWWSFSAGQPILSTPNADSAITSQSVLREADSRARILVSAVPQPGNWVQPVPGRSLEFSFLVADDGKLREADLKLPDIKRVGC